MIAVGIVPLKNVAPNFSRFLKFEYSMSGEGTLALQTHSQEGSLNCFTLFLLFLFIFSHLISPFSSLDGTFLASFEGALALVS